MPILADIADLIRRQGDIAAAGERSRGDIWSQAINSIGQIASRVPEQVQQARRQKQEQEIRDMQIASLKNAALGQQRANQIVSSLPRLPDGSFDTGELMQRLAGKDVPIDEQAKIAKSIDDVNNVMRAATKSQQDHRADLADFILKSHKADDPITPDAVHLGMAAARAAGLASDKDEQQVVQALGSGVDPRKVLEGVRAQGSRFKDEDKITFAPRDSSAYAQGGTIHPVPTAQRPPTEAELDAEYQKLKGKLATGGELTTDEQAAVKGYEARKNIGKSGSAEQDDQRYRNIQAALVQKQPVTPEDLAWAKGYEKQKTLGVDTSASASAIRQTNAIAAQTEQQRRAQSFAESQAGRKELTDKVEQPYLDAKEKAATLRSVIEAAKNGNMEAANVQSLLGTLGLVTMEGVKRINTTELQQVAGAGSLLERIKGAVGGLVAGKPMSEKLQNDLSDLSRMLEQSARAKYREGFQQVTKRYGLADEKPLDQPHAGETASIAQVNAIAQKSGKTYAEAKKFLEDQGYVIK